MPNPVRPLTQALALLAAAGLCAAAANALAGPGRRLAWAGRAPAATAPAPPVIAAPPPPPAPALAASAPRPRPAETFAASATTAIREITSDQAWAAFGQRVPFVDARRSADFAEGHVAGAWSVPVWEEACDRRITEFEARANPAPRDPIVIYCSGGCEDSRLLAAKLQGLGYRNLLIYTDGFPDWQARSRPAAAGGLP